MLRKLILAGALMATPAAAHATIYELAVIPFSDRPPAISMACHAENTDIPGIVNEYKSYTWKDIASDHAYGVLGGPEDLERLFVTTDLSYCQQALGKLISSGFRTDDHTTY